MRKYLLAYAMLLSGMDWAPRSSRQQIKDVKKCLLCGKEHNHNNAFCCAEHCREWNRKRKEAKR